MAGRTKRILVTGLVPLALFGIQIWSTFDPEAVPYPLGLLVLFISLIFSLVVFVGILVSIFRFDPRRFAMRTASLAFTVLIVLKGATIADYVHLVLMHPRYMTVIADRTEPVYFDWGWYRAGWPSPLIIYRILIYDAGDVRVGNERRPPPNDEDITIEHLFGYFYLKDTTKPEG
jgi:hypothetical protein